MHCLTGAGKKTSLGFVYSDGDCSAWFQFGDWGFPDGASGIGVSGALGLGCGCSFALAGGGASMARGGFVLILGVLYRVSVD